MKLIIVGEHSANHAGFSQLTHNISKILNKEFGEKIDIVTIGYACGNQEEGKSEYTIMTAGIPAIVGSMQGLMLAEDRKCGIHTLRKVLQTTKDRCVVLTIGDPWTFWYMKTTKHLFPNMSWISYLPVESTELITVAKFDYPGRIISADIARLYQQADKIIAYTDNGMNAINDLIGEVACESFIYHGVDNEKFAAVKTKTFEILENKFVVGTVARNGYRKALDVIMIGFKEFLSRLNGKGPKPILLLHTPRHDTFGWNIMSLAKKLKIDDNLIISDVIVESFSKRKDRNGKIVSTVKKGASLDDLVSLYKSMDCYINMSRGEGFGIPVVEAMSLGIPVVYIDHANLAEICKNRGYPVKVGGYEYKETYEVISAIASPESMGDSLLSIYEAVNKGKRKRLDTVIENAKKYTKSIDWKNMAEPWTKALRPILEDTRKRIDYQRRIVFVSTYETSCGIATYTENLMKHLQKIDKGTEYIVIDDTKEVDKYIDLILSNPIPTIVHIQYEPNLYTSKALVGFISKLKSLSSGNLKIVMTMHKEDIRSIKTLDGLVDALILHADNHNIQGTTKYTNINVLPHPFYTGTEIMKTDAREAMRKELGFKADQMVIGTAGFLLTYKMILQIAKEIISLMADKKQENNYGLFLPIAIHRNDQVGYAKKTVEEIERFAEEKGVSDRIVIKLRFHPQEQLMKYLQCIDVGFMYVNSENVGANSGSVRMLISCGVPCIIPSKGMMHKDLYNLRSTFNVAAVNGPEDFIRSGLKFVTKHQELAKSMRTNCIGAALRNNFATFASAHITRAYARLFSTMITINQEVADGQGSKQVDGKIQEKGRDSDRSDESRREAGPSSG